MARYTCSGLRINDADKTKIWRLHCEGLESRAIAERFGVSRDAVTAVLKAHRPAALGRAQLATGD